MGKGRAILVTLCPSHPTPNLNPTKQEHLEEGRTWVRAALQGCPGPNNWGWVRGPPQGDNWNLNNLDRKLKGRE